MATRRSAARSPKQSDGGADQKRGVLLQRLEALDRKVLWLATWMIHNANHIRPTTMA